MHGGAENVQGSSCIRLWIYNPAGLYVVGERCDRAEAVP